MFICLSLFVAFQHIAFGLSSRTRFPRCILLSSVGPGAGCALHRLLLAMAEIPWRLVYENMVYVSRKQWNL